MPKRQRLHIWIVISGWSTEKDGGKALKMNAKKTKTAYLNRDQWMKYGKRRRKKVIKNECQEDKDCILEVSGWSTGKDGGKKWLKMNAKKTDCILEVSGWSTGKDEGRRIKNQCQKRQRLHIWIVISGWSTGKDGGKKDYKWMPRRQRLHIWIVISKWSTGKDGGKKGFKMNAKKTKTAY